jgi:hypothetical protein
MACHDGTVGRVSAIHGTRFHRDWNGAVTHRLTELVGYGADGLHAESQCSCGA